MEQGWEVFKSFFFWDVFIRFQLEIQFYRSCALHYSVKLHISLISAMLLSCTKYRMLNISDRDNQGITCTAVSN